MTKPYKKKLKNEKENRCFILQILSLDLVQLVNYNS